MQKFFFALRAISYEGTQTCDRFTKNVESADRFTKNVDVDVERRVCSQTTFSVWVSFSPAPEQKGLPTENSLFQTPSGNEKKTLFFSGCFSVFFRFQREISRKLEILRFSETATEVHKLFENQKF